MLLLGNAPTRGYDLFLDHHLINDSETGWIYVVGVQAVLRADRELVRRDPEIPLADTHRYVAEICGACVV